MMMKAGGAFNFPIFKRKKKKNKVSSSISPKNITTTSKGHKGIITTTCTSTSTVSSSHSTSFGIVRCTTSTNNYYSSNDWFVFEVLTRLPVKSLFRFKSVSKNWCSLIQKDQQLMDLHFTRSQTRLPHRFFIALTLPPDTKDEQYRLREFGPFLYSRKKKLHITADLVSEEEEQVYTNNGAPTGQGTKLKLVVDTVREITKPSYHTISKPINGLICLIDTHTKPVARLCNISTGELSPWFPVNYYFDSSYAFGFDPATNEYKLVRVWRDQEISRIFCDVLTIGRQGVKNHNTWRKIKEVTQLGCTRDYVYVNGVIYWYPPDWLIVGVCRDVIFVAFDVGSEKFKTITIPDFVLRDVEKPNDIFEIDYVGKLLEVNGSLAMVVRLNNQTFKMYLYKDDGNTYKEEEKINGMSTGSCSRRKNGRWRHKKGIWRENNKRWSEVSTITLPLQMGNDHRVKFHTFVGSDDKIFITISILGMEKKKCVSIYCYNWKKFSLTEVDVSGIPSSIPQLCPQSFFATFSESLLSIDSQCFPTLLSDATVAER